MPTEAAGCRFMPDVLLSNGGLARIFVTPRDASLILYMFRTGDLLLHRNDVVVGPEYEEAVRTCVASLPHSAKVRRKDLKRLDLLSAHMHRANLAGSQSVPYSLYQAPLAAGEVLTVSRTFLDVEEASHEQTQSPFYLPGGFHMSPSGSVSIA